MLSADLTPADVPERLKLYEKARKQRAENVQQATRLVGSGLAESEAADCKCTNVAVLLGNVLIGDVAVEKQRDFTFRHDEIASSEKLLQEHLSTASVSA